MWFLWLGTPQRKLHKKACGKLNLNDSTLDYIGGKA